MGDETERVRLWGEAMVAIAALRRLVTDDTRAAEAEAVARYAILAMVGVRYPNTGEELVDADTVHRMWKVLNGGDPRRDDDDAIGYRRCAAAMGMAARELDLHGIDVARYAARYVLSQIDPALNAVGDADLDDFIARVRADNSISGVIADLLLSTGALGTPKTEDRQALQDKIGKRLKPKGR
jgi:hypothetical protein